MASVFSVNGSNLTASGSTSAVSGANSVASGYLSNSSLNYIPSGYSMNGSSWSNIWDEYDNFKNGKTILKDFLSYLKQDEIEKILDTIKSRISDEDEFIKISLSVISSRHFSEGFLMKYIPKDFEKYKDLFETAVLAYHYEDIKSSDYNELYLLLEFNKK